MMVFTDGAIAHPHPFKVKFVPRQGAPSRGVSARVNKGVPDSVHICTLYSSHNPVPSEWQSYGMGLQASATVGHGCRRSRSVGASRGKPISNFDRNDLSVTFVRARAMAASLYSPQLNRDDHHYALKGLLQQTHKGKYPLLFSKIPASSSNCACRFFVLTLAELESLTVGPQPIEPSEENFWVLFSWMSMPLETVSQQTDAVAYNLLVLTNETEGLSGYGRMSYKPMKERTHVPNSPRVSTASVETMFAIAEHPNFMVYFSILLSFIVAAIAASYFRPSRAPLPPGPRGFITSLSRRDLFRVFHQYYQRYGPIISVKTTRGPLVIIAGYQAAVDVMQKRGSDLADRPYSVSAMMVSKDLRVLNMGVGERLKRLRRIMHFQMQPSVANTYQPIQYVHAKNFMLDLLHSPDQHLQHARRYAASAIMSITYGKTTPTQYTDPEVVAIQIVADRIAAMLPVGNGWVDRFPFLRFLPIPEVMRLRRYHHEELLLFSSLRDAVRKRIEDKEHVPPNVLTRLWDNQQEYHITDDELTYLAGSMFGAGSDTTASALGFVIMAAALFPKEWARVQAQIDSVVGHSRLPTFEDYDELPLVTSFVLESYRWRPVSPSGIPETMLGSRSLDLTHIS
ncbi:hypothetical protein NLI96_g1779 [Meripilus lineatus]|uniref:Cytochrome P450 n=1 Tax=Meripilus lineatus TaxID=2056292 RepID=A0AAD5YMI7_9APHY|nr:hypothetical protein NLI96_g1779 [Physisporinus lineatus]